MKETVKILSCGEEKVSIQRFNGLPMYSVELVKVVGFHDFPLHCVVKITDSFLKISDLVENICTEKCNNH